VFIAVCDDGIILKSSDAQNWYEPSSGQDYTPFGSTPQWSGICYSEDDQLFVVVGDNGAGTSYIITSSWVEAGAGIIEAGYKPSYYADFRKYSTGDEDEEGVLTTGVLSSSNANQYFENVYLYYTRKKNRVSIVGRCSCRSVTAETLEGTFILTPPAHLTPGNELGVYSAVGHMLRSGGSIANNSPLVYNAASVTIRTSSVLYSVQGGLGYSIYLQYTMKSA